MFRATAALFFLLSSSPVLGPGASVLVQHQVPLTPEQVAGSPGITAGDIAISVMGRPVPVQSVRVINSQTLPPETPWAARLFVFHLDRGLNFRQDFRSRRWLKRFVRHLNPARDFVAVHRSGALSHFSSDRSEIETLIDYFSTEFDRFKFAPPRVRDQGWFQRSFWPFGPRYRGADQESGSSASELMERKIPGNLRDTLSSIRSLPGRKVLLYFGQELPFQESQVEAHNSDAALQWAQDAGVTGYAIVPGRNYREPSPVAPDLAGWAQATGGRALAESPDLLGHLLTILAETENYLNLQFQAPAQFGGGFQSFRAVVRTPTGEVQSQGGYFDLIESDAPLFERAFLTAGLGGEDTSFPIDLRSQPSEFRGLVVEMAFPLEAIRFEEIKNSSGQREGIFQEFNLFLGLYGERDQLLDYVEERFEIDLEESEIRGFFPRNATLKRVLESRFRTAPVRLRAVVVVGQSRQIARRDLTLP